jgi:hypothetical protein
MNGMFERIHVFLLTTFDAAGFRRKPAIEAGSRTRRIPRALAGAIFESSWFVFLRVSSVSSVVKDQG